MEKCIKGCCCLWSELDNFIYSGRVPEPPQSYLDVVSFEGYCDSYGFTSPEATRLQRNILNHYKNGEEVVDDT